MFSNLEVGDLKVKIAKYADLIFKPNIHSVLLIDEHFDDSFNMKDCNDINLEVHVRHSDGTRLIDLDLILEIYKSGNGETVMLSSKYNDEKPILWYSKYPMWIDSKVGKKVDPPMNSETFESFVRKILTLI